jgi:hypothetical protein
MSNFPARVSRVSHGTGLVATRDLAEGTVVAVFEGPIVDFAAVPDAELSYALWLDGERWMIPGSDARWINHACAPNCTVLDRVDDPMRFDVVTMRCVSAGSELTIAYNRVGNADELASTFWHEAWSFDCRCGSPVCRGRIDGYEVET